MKKAVDKINELLKDHKPQEQYGYFAAFKDVFKRTTGNDMPEMTMKEFYKIHFEIEKELD